MRILLTGAYGFIGRNLVDYFHNQGFYVSSLTESNKSNSKLTSELRIAKIHNLNSNRFLLESVQQLEIDAIVHAAGLIDTNATYSELQSANVHLTEEIAEFTSRSGIKKLIYLSSIPVIGSPPNFPINEEFKASPTSSYHKSKFEAEGVLQKRIEESIVTVILRIPAPIGKYMPKSRLIIKLMESIKNGADPKIFLHGERIQNYIDVKDLGRAIILTQHYHKSDLFLVPGSSTISNFALAKLIIEITGEKRMVMFENSIDPCDQEKWFIDGSKISATLKYSPIYELKDSLNEIWKNL